MSDQQPTPDPSAPAAESEETPPTSSAPEIDLDTELQRFAEATRGADAESPRPAKPGREPAEADRPVAADPAGELREYMQVHRDLAELRLWAVDVQRTRLAQQEQEDAQTVFGLGRSSIADIEHLTDEYAEQWLRNQYMVDPELHAAWDNRYASDDALRWCNRCVRHAMRNLHEEAKRESARIAGLSVTEDRAAIVAAMTRGRGVAPEGKAPDFARMTDSELREHTEKNYGFAAI
jgi:hypothetical protein